MTSDETRARARQALIASALLVVLLGVLKHISFNPLLQKIGFTIAVAFQLYVPLWLIDRSRERASVYGIHMHGSIGAPLALLRRRLLRAARARGRGSLPRWLQLKGSRILAPYAHRARFDPKGFTRDMVQVGVLCLLTFPPFIIGHHYWQVWGAKYRGLEARYAFDMPHNFVEVVAINLLLVALPEELFYRGFVQTRLLRAWPPWLVRFGVPVGWAIIVASGLFALGHYAGEWGNPARLGPFFPALVFSAMRARSGSIMGAVMYHGFANIFSESLRAGYTFS